MPSIILCPYQPIEVQALYEGKKINDLYHMRPWKMNLMAGSRRDNSMFFIAVEQSIHVYRTAHPLEEEIEPFKKLKYDGMTDSTGPINAIRCGEIGNKEVLVAVDDDGYVVVWFTEDLERRPIIQKHRESAWGVAMHGYLLAVSANSHTILIWNFRASTEGGDDAADAEEDPLRGVNERELVGHDHNIPAIDFSECGRYLVSGSIDETLRIWNVRTGQTIFSRAIDDQWLWAVKFISPSNLKRILSNTPESINPFVKRPKDIVATIEKRLKISRKTTKQSYSSRLVGSAGGLSDTEFGEESDEEREESGDERGEMGVDEKSGSEVSGVDDVGNLAGGNIDLEPSDVAETLACAKESSADMRSPSANTVTEMDVTISTSDEPTPTFPADPHSTLNDDDDSLPPLTHSEDQEDSEDEEEDDLPPLALSDSNPSSWSSPSLPPSLIDDSENSDAPSTSSPPGMIHSDSSEQDLTDSTDSQQWEDATDLLNGTSPFSLNFIRTWRMRGADQISPVPRSDSVTRLSSQIILCTSKENLYLLDATEELDPLHSIMKLTGRLDPRLDAVLNHFDRLCMVEWIAELGVAIVASQKGTATLVRVLRTQDEKKGESRLMLTVEDILPHRVPPMAPLLGMFISKHPSNCLPTYRVHFLYANARMFAYELSTSSLVNPVAIDGVFC